MKTKAGTHALLILTAVIAALTPFLPEQNKAFAHGEHGRGGADVVVAPKATGDYIEGAPEPEKTPLIRQNPKIEGLRKQIEEREEMIEKTEEEIEGINKELTQISQKKNTLQNELSRLDLTNRRNEEQINVTEEDVEKRVLTLESLGNSIDDNVENIKTLRRVLRKNYQRANEFELQATETLAFFHSSFFELVRRMEDLDRYSEALNEQLDLLENETNRLEENKEGVMVERKEIEQKQKELEDRRRIYNISIANKKSLVGKTRNDEATHQRQLLKKQQERLKLQQEISDYESRIEYLHDPSTVPPPRKGLLRIPLSAPVRVTQNFGATDFARANALRYGKPFHDGIDFGIPSGTKLFASADGTIVGTGNTDLVSTCQSWGKWVLIKHEFGLSTLYAHLSLIKAQVGQKVKAGDLIGYTGNTGFSTGAHLHLGVYASRGIRVVPYEEVSAGSRCRGLLVPVAAKDAKLDPRSYLAL